MLLDLAFEVSGVTNMCLVSKLLGIGGDLVQLIIVFYVLLIMFLTGGLMYGEDLIVISAVFPTVIFGTLDIIGGVTVLKKPVLAAVLQLSVAGLSPLVLAIFGLFFVGLFSGILLLIGVSWHYVLWIDELLGVTFFYGSNIKESSYHEIETN